MCSVLERYAYFRNFNIFPLGFYVMDRHNVEQNSTKEAKLNSFVVICIKPWSEFNAF